MMPSKSHPGGEGAIGSAVARFFHPSKPIREKWPDYKKLRLTGVVILGRGERRINRKLVRNAYRVRITEIANKVFFIHPSSPDPSKIFADDERVAATTTTGSETITAVVDPNCKLRVAQTNVIQNFEVGGQEEDLQFQGMEIENRQ